MRHACLYCARGDTQILMGDGRTKPLAEIRAGRPDLRHRPTSTSTAATSSPKCWTTGRRSSRPTGSLSKTARRSCASGDHRFLTARGKWKHVTGAEQGALRRPHLTLNDKLMGTGAFAEPPDHNAEYRAGYLCGMIRGDGHIGSRAVRPARTGDQWTHHRFRLALVDMEALRRDARVPRRDRGTRPGVPVRRRGRIQRGDQRDPHAEARTTSMRSGRDPVASLAERRLAQGLPRRHLRCRGQLRRVSHPSDLEYRSGAHRPDSALPAAARVSTSRRRAPDNENGARRASAFAAASASTSASSTRWTRPSAASAPSTGQ